MGFVSFYVIEKFVLIRNWFLICVVFRDVMAQAFGVKYTVTSLRLRTVKYNFVI